MNMKTRTRIHTVLAGFLPLVALVLAWGCTMAEPEHSGGNEAVGPDMPVVINASEYRLGNAKRAGGNQMVKSRRMLFTYPSRPSGEMKSAVCVFDEKGYGFVYIGDPEDKESLKWKDLYTEKQGGCDVYLDNLLNFPVQEADVSHADFRKRYDNFKHIEFIPGASDPTEYELTGKGNIVMVAEAGSPKAENLVDIVWGRIPNAEAGKPLHFELTHKMSQLTFRLYSEEEPLQNKLAGGKNIKVTLVYVQRSLTRNAGSPNHPRSEKFPPFRRTDGHIELSGRSENENENILFNEGSLREEADVEDGRTYYSSRTMVLPPYEHTGQMRMPSLTVELDDGTKFSGGLPSTIDYWYIDNKGEVQLGQKTALWFISTYHTIFYAKLYENMSRREILFQNVKVEDWETMYSDTVVIAQSGINTWDDLTALAEVFKEDPSEDNYRLMKYGEWVGNGADGHWVFYLWKNITVSDSQTIPQFVNGNFEIRFEGHWITVGTTEINQENYRQYLYPEGQ